jgi:transcriptional regulator with XRE-family HTH domain
MDKVWTLKTLIKTALLLHYTDDIVLPAKTETNMYITQEELDKRLSKTSLSIKTKERKERGEEKRLDHNDRVLIGILSEIDTPKNIADLMGITTQTVSNVSRGLTSPTIGVDKDLKKDVEDSKTGLVEGKKKQEEIIKDQLVTNLAAALGHVANNLGNTKAPEASKIAVDMSNILNRIGTNGDNNKGSKTAIIINVPPMKEERHYQVIDV